MIRRADLLWGLLYLLWVACWSLAVPYNGAPDEQTHMFLVEYLYRFHALPVAGHDPATAYAGLLSGDAFTSKTFWYFGLPYIHVLGATGYAMLLAPLLPTGAGYLAARAFDWSLGALFVVCLLSIARRQGLRGPWPYAAAGVIALIPQVTFVFAYFNADAFALACTAGSLALFLRFADSPTPRTGWPFGVACGLLLCSKIYHFPALVFFAGLLAVLKWIAPQRALARPIAAAVAGALLVAVPVIGFTYAQFGEVAGLQGQQAFVALHRAEPGALYGTCFVLCRDALVHAHWLHWWGDNFLHSFFMTTGWMAVRLPGVVYRLFFNPAALLLFVASMVMAARAIGRVRAGDRAALWDVAIVTLFWGMLIGTTLFNLFGSQNLLPQPQGRYLFVVLPFAALLVARLVAGSATATPSRAARLVPTIAVLMLVANVASLAVTARAAGGYPAVGQAKR